MSWIANAWHRASGRQRIVIAAALLVAIGAVATGLSGTGGVAEQSRGATASPSPSTSAVAVLPSPTQTLEPSSLSSPTIEPTPTQVATAVPTPQPTSVATVKPTPKPTLTLVFTSLTSPAARGSNATATVQTVAGAYCTIVVTYKSGASSAAGLTPTDADGSGVASWTWKVGTKTTLGSWPVKVTCSAGGLSKSMTKYFQVT